MRKLLIGLLAILIFTGCSLLNNDRLKWFKNEMDAVNYCFKEEKIIKQDLIRRVEKDGEIFIFYRISIPDGSGLGLANLIQKDEQYAWYRADPYVIVKQRDTNKGTEVQWKTETRSGKNYTVYAGSIEDNPVSLKTSKGTVEPYIDKDSGIYFYIE